MAALIAANILSKGRDEIRLNRSTSTLAIIPTAFLASLNERAEDFGPILLEGGVALQSAPQHGVYTVLSFWPPERCSKRSKGDEEPIERRQRDLVDEIFCRNESAPIEGHYLGVTDQVKMSETPGFFRVPVVPRGSSRPEWLSRKGESS